MMTTPQFALLSLVYMISFVLMFDRLRYRHKLGDWLCGANLMNGEELKRIMAIWSACAES